MENLHPTIVHFPITLLFLVGLFGLISIFWKRELWKDLAVICRTPCETRWGHRNFKQWNKKSKKPKIELQNLIINLARIISNN